MLGIPKEYRINEPYPEIKRVHRDNNTLFLLQNLYCSQKSEITAVLNYSYQNNVTRQFNEQLAEAFIHIGMVEMHHLDILGNAILSSGGNPIYADSQNIFLSGKWADYSTNIVKMLENDIQAEIQAVNAYSKAAEATDQDISALLLRIAADENLHAEILTDLLKQVKFWIG